MNGRKLVLLGACALVSAVLLALPGRARAAGDKVKVFILAGQSNMEGKAPNALLEHQAEAPETKDLFKHYRKDGKWIVRADVLADNAAEELFPNWQKNSEKWKTVGGDRPYHYLGSAIWFTRIGHAMGEAMLELMK